MRETIFTGLEWPSNPLIENILYGSVALMLTSLVMILVLERGKDARNIYYNHLAWLRAFIYFGGCLVVSALTGVMDVILSSALPDMGAKSTGWHITLDAWLIIVLVGYLGFWRRGTVTLGRKYYWTAIPFGLMWGLSEAQLMLGFWSLAEMTGLSVLWVAIITYVMVSIFNTALHVLFWDTYVAPGHNITEWNMKKVSFSHTPNLFVGLIFLSLYGDPLVFVMVQTLALTICTNIMRFPPFWPTEANGVPVVKGGNIAAADLGLDPKTAKLL